MLFLGRCELAVIAAVDGIDAESDGEPSEETDPREDGETHHEQKAEKHAGNRGRMPPGARNPR